MPEATAPTHECPAPGCPKRVPRHQFACPRDWVRLPAEMRREINATYRRNWPAHIRAMQAAIDWYQQNEAPGAGVAERRAEDVADA